MMAAPPPTVLARALLGIALGAAFAVSGCVFGPSIDGLAPARTGHGVEIRIASRATASSSFGAFSGELLAVREDALLLHVPLLRDDPVTLISYAVIGSAEVVGLDRLSFGDGAAPSAEQREELRLLSRYPQGVSDDLLRRLLAAYDQDELTTVP